MFVWRSRPQDTPQFIEVPQALLKLVKGCRDTAAEWVAGDGGKMATMITTMTGKTAHAKKIDRSFVCDLEFLNKHAQSALHDKLQQKTLECLPSEGNPVTLVQAMLKLGEVRRSDLYYAAGASIQGAVDSADALVMDLHRGYKPEVGDVARHSSFFKLVLKSAEKFFTLEVFDNPKPGTLNFAKTKVVGSTTRIRSEGLCTQGRGLLETLTKLLGVAPLLTPKSLVNARPPRMPEHIVFSFAAFPIFRFALSGQARS